MKNNFIKETTPKKNEIREMTLHDEQLHMSKGSPLETRQESNPFEETKEHVLQSPLEPTKRNLPKNEMTHG